MSGAVGSSWAPGRPSPRPPIPAPSRSLQATTGQFQSREHSLRTSPGPNRTWPRAATQSLGGRLGHSAHRCVPGSPGSLGRQHWLLQRPEQCGVTSPQLGAGHWARIPMGPILTRRDPELTFPNLQMPGRTLHPWGSREDPGL